MICGSRRCGPGRTSLTGSSMPAPEPSGPSFHLVAEAYVWGVSTHRVAGLVETLGVASVSKSQVSDLAKDLDAMVADFGNRPLDQGPYPYVWVDALAMKVREGGRIVNIACMAAVGVNAEGRPRDPRCGRIDHRRRRGLAGLLPWSTQRWALEHRGGGRRRSSLGCTCGPRNATTRRRSSHAGNRCTPRPWTPLGLPRPTCLPRAGSPEEAKRAYSKAHSRTRRGDHAHGPNTNRGSRPRGCR